MARAREVGALLSSYLKQSQHCPRNGKLVKTIPLTTVSLTWEGESPESEPFANESGYQSDKTITMVLRRASPSTGSAV